MADRNGCSTGRLLPWYKAMENSKSITELSEDFTKRHNTRRIDIRGQECTPTSTRFKIEVKRVFAIAMSTYTQLLADLGREQKSANSFRASEQASLIFEILESR